jgi:hypothetical protein
VTTLRQNHTTASSPAARSGRVHISAGHARVAVDPVPKSSSAGADAFCRMADGLTRRPISATLSHQEISPPPTARRGGGELPPFPGADDAARPNLTGASAGSRDGNYSSLRTTRQSEYDNRAKRVGGSARVSRRSR